MNRRGKNRLDLLKKLLGTVSVVVVNVNDGDSSGGQQKLGRNSGIVEITVASEDPGTGMVSRGAAQGVYASLGALADHFCSRQGTFG